MDPEIINKGLISETKDLKQNGYSPEIPSAGL
jgi:hypothetical protein